MSGGKSFNRMIDLGMNARNHLTVRTAGISDYAADDTVTTCRKFGAVKVADTEERACS